MTSPNPQSPYEAAVEAYGAAERAYAEAFYTQHRNVRSQFGREAERAKAAVIAARPGPMVTNDVKLARFLLEDCATYIDTLYERCKIPPLKRGMDTDKVRAAAAALRVMPLAEERTDAVALVEAFRFIDRWLADDKISVEERASIVQHHPSLIAARAVLSATPAREKAAQPAPDGGEGLAKALEPVMEKLGEPPHHYNDDMLWIGRMTYGEVRRAREALAAYRARHAAPSDSGGKRWRHKKRGTTYTEVGRAELQIACDPEGFQNHILHEEDTIIVYRSDADGKLWAREAREFEDGRFEELGPPPRTDVDAAQRENGK